MATRYQSGGYWYVKYKHADGKWKNKFCGKSATANDAELIRKKYDAEELNRRHKMVVRMVDANLVEQLRIFRDEEIPRSTTGRPKGHKTIQRYKAIINNLLEWMEEQKITRYDQIGEEQAKKFFDSLHTLKRSASTISKHRQTLIQFWQWSIAKAYTQHNPFTVISNPKRTKKVPYFFTDSQLAEIFAKATDPYPDIFRFLYLTGLRIGELGNLEWSDYTESQRTITLRVIEGNKTKREEVVPLNKDALAVIDRQWQRRESWHTQDALKYVFVNANGWKLDNANIYRAVQVTLKRCGITKGSPHTFRHTCASHLVIKGVSLYIVKDILRHASIRETEIYAHLSKDATQTAVELLTASSSTTAQPQNV